MRTLYQRRQDRDLFDMAIAMKSGKTDPDRIVAPFQQYMEHEAHKVTRAMFEEKSSRKLDPDFVTDISSCWRRATSGMRRPRRRR